MHNRKGILAALLGLAAGTSVSLATAPSYIASPQVNYVINTGMHSGRGKGGKTAHRRTGIRAQKRAALKARNRARA